MATVDDVEDIVRILIATKVASLPGLIDDHDRDIAFWTNRWRSYIQEGSRAQMATGDGFAVIAEVENAPVGFAAYHHTRRHDTQAELQSIYVRKEAQGSGIGTLLLRFIATRLHDEGTTTMCVGYDPRNPYKRFYLKQGAIEISPHWAMWQDVSRIIPESP
jgi:GNAT superfamily N-acetyltransferase